MRMDSEGILRFVSQLEGLGVLDEGSVTDCERVELDRFSTSFGSVQPCQFSEAPPRAMTRDELLL